MSGVLGPLMLKPGEGAISVGRLCVGAEHWAMRKVAQKTVLESNLKFGLR